MGLSGLWDLFQRGGPLMWPLLASSITAVGLIVDRVWVYWSLHQRFDRFLAGLEPLVTGGDWEAAQRYCESRGVYSHLARYYLDHRDDPKDVREEIVRREGSVTIGHLESRVRWLATLAQIATLLGLMATFHVMISRFQDGAAGGQVQPADFTAAIWEALLTTMYGLGVAIPCVAAYQLFEGQLDAITRNMGILVGYLDEWRRTAEQRARARAATAAIPGPPEPRKRLPASQKLD